VESSSQYFRGSELPRLLILAAIMAIGWGLVWQFAQQQPQPVDPPVKGGRSRLFLMAQSSSSQ
jgi:hypothetical protein